MTHGEAYFYRRQNIDFKADVETITARFDRLPKRMSRENASAYYGKKIRESFVGMGLIPHFNSADEEYDYYEAKRILNEIRKRGLNEKIH